jgi:hypothetical protein
VSFLEDFVMAFAVTKYKAYGLYVDEPITKRALQVFEMTFTRASADVNADISDSNTSSDAFWSDALADSTYAAVASGARSAWFEVLSKADKLIDINLVGANDILMRTIGTITDAKLYQITNAGAFPVLAPNITFIANSAPATVSMVATFTLTDEQRAVRASS